MLVKAAAFALQQPLRQAVLIAELGCLLSSTLLYETILRFISGFESLQLVYVFAIDSGSAIMPRGDRSMVAKQTLGGRTRGLLECNEV